MNVPVCVGGPDAYMWYICRSLNARGIRDRSKVLYTNGRPTLLRFLHQHVASFFGFTIII